MAYSSYEKTHIYEASQASVQESQGCVCPVRGTIFIYCLSVGGSRLRLDGSSGIFILYISYFIHFYFISLYFILAGWLDGPSGIIFILYTFLLYILYFILYTGWLADPSGISSATDHTAAHNSHHTEERDSAVSLITGHMDDHICPQKKNWSHG